MIDPSVPIVLGFSVPPLADQVAAAGLTLEDPDAWEDRHAAWNLLRFSGLLTDNEALRISRRLVQGVQQAARCGAIRQRLGKELADLQTAGGEAVLARPSEAEAPLVISPSPEKLPDAFSEYLASRGA